MHSTLEREALDEGQVLCLLNYYCMCVEQNPTCHTQRWRHGKLWIWSSLWPGDGNVERSHLVFTQELLPEILCAVFMSNIHQFEAHI